MPDSGENTVTEPLSDDELLVLGIACDVGFVRRRPVERPSTRALDELVDAGLLRAGARGYIPTALGYKVHAANEEASRA